MEQAETQPEQDDAPALQQEPDNSAGSEPDGNHQRKFHLVVPRIPKFSPWLVVLLVVVVLNLGAGVGNAYLRWYQHVGSKTASSDTLVLPTTTHNDDGKAVTPSDTTTLHYSSEALSVDFDYPIDWRVSGSADDKTITLTSAPINISGEQYIHQAVLTVNITDPSSNYDTFGFLSESDVITRDSDSLDYANPSKFQRKSTHLSFASSQMNDKFEFIFVSGNLVYTKGQTVGSKNYRSINPHIDAYLDPCYAGNGHCQAFTTVPITNTQWSTDQTLEKFRNVVKSLRFTK